MPAITLDDAAREMLTNYYWRGNIRQLKNVAEQISAVEQVRLITPEVLRRYLPEMGAGAGLAAPEVRRDEASFANERELLYKLLFDMRAEIGDLKRMVAELMHRTGAGTMESRPEVEVKALLPGAAVHADYEPAPIYAESEEVFDEPRERTKADVQREQIVKALRRHGGRRRDAAAELFMSERTLYRKIKELGIEE